MSTPDHESDAQLALSSSHPWTRADSAAGFVLRYVSAMRGQLIDCLGSEKLSDHALTLFIGHLVNRGYGGHGQGRLRDFLILGIRSAAKAALAKVPETQRPDFDPHALQPDSPDWIEHWRMCIWELSWRTLEQQQHKHPGQLDYTVLKLATDNPQSTSAMLAVQVSTAAGEAIDAARIEQLLPAARQRFTQIIATEIANTLHNPTADSIAAERKALRL
ncbi:hypothetical protein [Roseimaritima ulvae]|uniref:Uncharacterized protein n=1 Tax=Roseimaritima ulvae TaxID=980254 RepID=A0A5B9R1C9_9BACT|nr:hypothetical protein [Roseimaritima ulvae]QEG43216.1 hypothetical protein UC8_52620 [Roseimaritima ulvae]